MERHAPSHAAFSPVCEHPRFCNYADVEVSKMADFEEQRFTNTNVSTTTPWKTSRQPHGERISLWKLTKPSGRRRGQCTMRRGQIWETDVWKVKRDGEERTWGRTSSMILCAVGVRFWYTAPYSFGIILVCRMSIKGESWVGTDKNQVAAIKTGFILLQRWT